jgi:Protein of unknown function (DUF3455)
MLARTPGRRTLLLGLGLAAVLGAALIGTAGSSSAAPAAALAADSTSSDSVPAAIRVPPGNRLIAQFDAQGVQVYQCTGGAWKFLEPVAALGDPGPAVIHFRGPSWESIRDGSLVEAATVASSPVPGAIPQLLLQATTTRGAGIFGNVTYVQRLDTAGGLAPTTTCKDGQTQGVPYTADYLFYVRG